MQTSHGELQKIVYSSVNLPAQTATQKCIDNYLNMHCSDASDKRPLIKTQYLRHDFVELGNGIWNHTLTHTRTHARTHAGGRAGGRAEGREGWRAGLSIVK